MRYATWTIALSLFWTGFAQATIVLQEKIKHISEIVDKIPNVEGNRGVGLFDWDRTIGDGTKTKSLRDPEEETGSLATIQRFHQKGYRTGIITSRSRGFGLMGGILSRSRYKEDGIAWEHFPLTPKDVTEESDESVQEFLSALSYIGWEEHGALIDPPGFQSYAEFFLPGLLSESTMGYDKRREIFALLAKHSIVFAGGNCVKGAATALLIDAGMFKAKPEIIVFVDDVPELIHEFAATFEHRPEQVYLFHYSM